MALFYPHYHLFYSLVIPLVSTVPMAGQQAAFPQSRFASPSCSHGHDGHHGHGSKQLCGHGQHDVAWTGPWKFDRMGVVDGCLYMDGWINVPNISDYDVCFSSNTYIANKCKMQTKNLWNTVLWDRKIRKWKSMIDNRLNGAASKLLDPQNGESVHESLRIINPSM